MGSSPLYSFFGGRPFANSKMQNYGLLCKLRDSNGLEQKTNRGAILVKLRLNKAFFRLYYNIVQTSQYVTPLVFLSQGLTLIVKYTKPQL